MVRLFAVIACLLFSGIAQRALAAEDFYKGKQISIYSSSSGTYEKYARGLAKYLPRYIPGEPNIIVPVMNGASGLTAANFLYNQAPRDGTAFALTHGHIPTLPLLNPQGTRFDPTKFSWIGSVTKEVFIAYVWHTSPIDSLNDLATKELTVGGQAPGSMSIDMAILAKQMLDLKLKIITGYSGSAETKLAMERGEIGGHFGTAWSSLKRENGEWLRDKKVKIITQFGFKPHPELPTVPLFVDAAKTAEDHQALELMLARQETAKPFYGPPDVPADRLAIIRNAFDKVMKDPQYLAEMEQQLLDVEQPMGWEEAAALVARLQQTPPSVVKRLLGAFDSFREGR
jgi:tripartite-type tricarboxylate transporter receptor subunit TctC